MQGDSSLTGTAYGQKVIQKMSVNSLQQDDNSLKRDSFNVANETIAEQAEEEDAQGS